MSAAVTRARAKQQRSGTNGVEPRVIHDEPEARVDDGPQQQRWKTKLTTDSDANSANANGMTPLMRAACDGLVDFVQVLLDRGADVNAKRNDGFSPLALAAFFGHSQVVRLLMERGADVEATTRVGTSAEMWADARGFIGVGNLLRETRERKDAQDPAPLPAVLQKHPRFPRPVAEERREEVGIVQEQHEHVDSETPGSLGGQPAWSGGTLETKPVKAHAVEVSSEGNSAVVLDHVVSGKSEHPATQTVTQPAPRAAKTLPEILDPPPIIATEFRPGSVFVARISSSWKSVAVLVIVVLIACGIAIFALPQTGRVLTGGQKEAVTNTTDLPAASSNPVAQPEKSVSSQIETPPAAPVELGTSAPSKTIEETHRDSESIGSARQSEPDEAQHKTSLPGAAKTDQPGSGSYLRPRNRIFRSSRKNSVLSVKTTLSRPSASGRNQDTVPAAAKLKQQALDPEPKPAPLSVEVNRSRAVRSTAPSSANESSGGQSTLGITPSTSKTKVIPWP
jgi:hypothetical protein